MFFSFTNVFFGSPNRRRVSSKGQKITTPIEHNVLGGINSDQVIATFHFFLLSRGDHDLFEVKDVSNADRLRAF
jgi:hypothetical protein